MDEPTFRNDCWPQHLIQSSWSSLCSHWSQDVCPFCITFQRVKIIIINIVASHHGSLCRCLPGNACRWGLRPLTLLWLLLSLLCLFFWTSICVLFRTCKLADVWRHEQTHQKNCIFYVFWWPTGGAVEQLEASFLDHIQCVRAFTSVKNLAMIHAWSMSAGRVFLQPSYTEESVCVACGGAIEWIFFLSDIKCLSISVHVKRVTNGYWAHQQASVLLWWGVIRNRFEIWNRKSEAIFFRVSLRCQAVK